MKSGHFAVSVVVLAALITGCSGGVRSLTAVEWLDALPQESRHDVSGLWKSPPGMTCVPFRGCFDTSVSIVLVQEGTRLTGNYAEYDILGVVSGDKVYLVGLYQGVVHYTWHFKYVPSASMMTGNMCDGYCPTVGSDCYHLALTK